MGMLGATELFRKFYTNLIQALLDKNAANHDSSGISL